MKRFIQRMRYTIKNIYVSRKSHKIAVHQSAILRKGSVIKSYKGEIKIDEGVAVEKGTKISAIDGGVIEIGKGVYFNEGCKVVSREKISVGENTLFGPNVLIYDHNHKFSFGTVSKDEFIMAPIIIGKNCWIGAGCIILKGSVIGDGTIVGAGTVISGIIPENVIAKNSRGLECEKIEQRC